MNRDARSNELGALIERIGESDESALKRHTLITKALMDELTYWGYVDSMNSCKRIMEKAVWEQTCR